MRYPLNYQRCEALLMSSDSDYAIKVESLSKCYQLFGKPSHRLRQSFLGSVRSYIKNSGFT